MKKVVTLGLIIASLLHGCKKEVPTAAKDQETTQHSITDPHGRTVEYHNPNKHMSVIPDNESKNISYNELVNLVKQNGGTLDIKLTAIEVAKEPPYESDGIGYGLGWTNKMYGTIEGNIAVMLSTTGIGRYNQPLPRNGKDRKDQSGTGFGWANVMHVNLGSNEFKLSNPDVRQIPAVPNGGRHGCAYTHSMQGSIGQLAVNYTTTEVAPFIVPNGQYKIAWANEGTLTISLRK